MEQTEKYRDKLLKNPEIQEMLEDYSKHKYKYYLLIGTLFIIFFVALIALFIKLPRLDPEDREIFFQFPNTKEKISNTANVLKKYSSSHSTYVLILFMYFYIFLQSFAIPGPAFLSILSGALWSFKFGLLVVSASASIGASICYILSQTFLTGFVINTWPYAVYTLKAKITERKNNLFFYILFLRFSPLIPNIGVNLGCPIAGVPLTVFFFGSLVGLIPLNIIHINTGRTLNDISNLGINTKQLLLLFVLGLVALVPTLMYKKKGKNKNY